jgi:hypothetical protein
MALDISYARGEYTKKVIGAFSDMAQPTLFFKSFFRPQTTEALLLSIEVERNGRQTAVDILRGTEGIITRSDKSTERVYQPPLFDYKYNLQQLDGYDRLFGESNEISGGHWARVIAKTARQVAKNVDRINRRYELQCAQALLDGIVTMKNGDNIDFNRKAASLVAYNAAHDWTINTVNPGAILEQGARFMVTEGLMSPGTTINAVMGNLAWNAFRDNELRQAEGDIKDQKFQDLTSPVPFGNGAVLMGRYSYGAYNFNIWGYEGYYDDPDNSNTTTPYMDSKKVILLPNDQDFEFGYGGVPAMVDVNGEQLPGTMEGEFVAYQYNDVAKTSAFFGVRSAGMPILTFVDRVFTVQVIV